MRLQIKKPINMTAKRPRVFCYKYVPLLESAVSMFFSPGGIGKSFAAVIEAIEFVLENPDKKAVLWLTEDSEGETRSRFDRAVKDTGKPREYFDQRISFICQEPLRLTKVHDGNAELTEEFWDIRMALLDYSLVILDPLLQFNGGDENSNTHAGVLMGALKTWAAEENKSILLLHHASLTADGKIKARGAGEWVNGCRAVYEVGLVKDENGDIDRDRLNKRRFKLYKDNGISYHFRDPITGVAERDLIVFPQTRETEEVEVNSGSTVYISVAHHNDEKNPHGFKKKKVDFYNLHEVVMLGTCYSPYIFANEHRLSSNNLGGSDIMCFDFDDGISLSEGVKRFKKYRSLLVTTKSHQKNGVDRFRAFIQLKTPLYVPESDYSDFMQYLFDKIGNVDPATKDLARFFYASPKDAEYIYSDSDELFDWESVYDEMKKKKVVEKIAGQKRKKIDFTNYNPDNTLPGETVFTDHQGNVLTFDDAKNRLSVGEKLRVECRHGHGHNKGHGPKYNKAAFIKKADNGNVFYHCSGGKCAGEEALWCEE